MRWDYLIECAKLPTKLNTLSSDSQLSKIQSSKIRLRVNRKALALLGTATTVAKHTQYSLQHVASLVVIIHNQKVGGGLKAQLLLCVPEVSVLSVEPESLTTFV